MLNNIAEPPKITTPMPINIPRLANSTFPTLLSNCSTLTQQP